MDRTPHSSVQFNSQLGFCLLLKASSKWGMRPLSSNLPLCWILCDAKPPISWHRNPHVCCPRLLNICLAELLPVHGHVFMFYCLSCLPSYLKGLSLALSAWSSVRCVSCLDPRPYLSVFLSRHLAHILTKLTTFEAWLMIDLTFKKHPRNFFQPKEL